MKKLKFLPAILLAALAISCGGDDDETIESPKTQLVVNETILFDGALTDEIENEFDAQNRIVSQLSNSTLKTYSWDSNGRIFKMVDGSGPAMRETTYTYNGNGLLLTKVRVHPNSSQTEDRREYSYFADRYEEKYYNVDNALMYQYKYYYTADKKNIALQKNYWGDGSYIGSYEFTYDSKVGISTVAPFSQIPAPFHNANNVTSTINRNASDVVSGSSEQQNNYNDQGFVTSHIVGNYTHEFEYIQR